MNKNIQSLVEDAGIDIRECELALVDKDAIEKFALSIIEDCIDQIIVDRYGRSGNWDLAIDNSIRNIKRHFGVE